MQRNKHDHSPYLMGIDVGTQSVRICVFTLDGVNVAQSIESLETVMLDGRQAEQEPSSWWAATVRAMKKVIELLGAEAAYISSVSYACTSCTVVVLDENGDALRPALMWMDERAVEEADRITASDSSVLKYSGGVVSPQWMLPKTLWLMNNERETFDQAHRIVEQTDFFTYQLTGKWTLSYQNMVAKWNYANPEDGWPEGFLEGVGLAEARTKWSDMILSVGAPVGRIRPALAAEVGLSADVMVVQGGIDSHAGMIGLSVIDPGEVGIIMGTSTVVMGQSDKPIYADIWGPYPDANIDGAYTIGGGQTTTGSVIQWLFKNLRIDVRDDFSAVLRQIEHEAEAVPAGSNGLVALEYFQGNRTPYKDTKARGALWGMTLWHSFPEIVRAFYEANAFGTRHILENLRQHDFQIKRIVGGGGHAQSDLMMRILADVCNTPLYRATEPHNTALGAAIWAGIGIGVFGSFREAVDSMVRMQAPVEPQPETALIYDFYFDKYVRTYEQLRGLMHEVVDFEDSRRSEAAHALQDREDVR